MKNPACDQLRKKGRLNLAVCWVARPQPNRVSCGGLDLGERCVLFAGARVFFVLFRGLTGPALILGGSRTAPPGIDRGDIEAGLDVGRVELLDHLDAGAAILGDLVDIRALHEAQANIRMA